MNPTLWLQYHSAIFTGLALITITGVVIAMLTGLENLPLEFQLIIASGLIIVGLPHGALDMVLARPLLQPHFGSRWLVIFVLSYSGLALSVIVLWSYAPTLSLAAFLIIAALHFGISDSCCDHVLAKEWSWLDGVARGSVIIAVPAAFHTVEVIALFSYLAPLATAEWLARCWSALAIPSGLVLVGLSIHQLITQYNYMSWRELSQIGERLVLLLLLVVAPPLIAFAVYFAALHAPRHLLNLRNRLQNHYVYLTTPNGWIINALVPTIITLIIAVIGGWQLLSWVSLTQAIVQVIFIGLAAVTVPHCVLSMCLINRRMR